MLSRASVRLTPDLWVPFGLNFKVMRRRKLSKKGVEERDLSKVEARRRRRDRLLEVE